MALPLLAGSPVAVDIDAVDFQDWTDLTPMPCGDYVTDLDMHSRHVRDCTTCQRELAD